MRWASIMSNDKHAVKPPEQPIAPGALVLPLGQLDRSLLPVVGGKAAALGELMGAGFAVPTGFCVTTAAYARIANAAGLDALLAELSARPTTDTDHESDLAA